MALNLRVAIHAEAKIYLPRIAVFIPAMRAHDIFRVICVYFHLFLLATTRPRVSAKGTPRGERIR
jgi:hypothetical protein